MQQVTVIVTYNSKDNADTYCITSIYAITRSTRELIPLFLNEKHPPLYQYTDFDKLQESVQMTLKHNYMYAKKVDIGFNLDWYDIYFIDNNNPHRVRRYGMKHT